MREKTARSPERPGLPSVDVARSFSPLSYAASPGEARTRAASLERYAAGADGSQEGPDREGVRGPEGRPAATEGAAAARRAGVQGWGAQPHCRPGGARPPGAALTLGG